MDHDHSETETLSLCEKKYRTDAQIVRKKENRKCFITMNVSPIDAYVIICFDKKGNLHGRKLVIKNFTCQQSVMTAKILY